MFTNIIQTWMKTKLIIEAFEILNSSLLPKEIIKNLLICDAGFLATLLMAFRNYKVGFLASLFGGPVAWQCSVGILSSGFYPVTCRFRISILVLTDPEWMPLHTDRCLNFACICFNSLLTKASSNFK